MKRPGLLGKLTNISLMFISTSITIVLLAWISYCGYKAITVLVSPGFLDVVFYLLTIIICGFSCFCLLRYSYRVHHTHKKGTEVPKASGFQRLRRFALGIITIGTFPALFHSLEIFHTSSSLLEGLMHYVVGLGSAFIVALILNFLSGMDLDL